MECDTISLDLIKKLPTSCSDGLLRFSNMFGEKDVPILEAFTNMPKDDVIQFIMHGLYSGECPHWVAHAINVSYHPNRKRPVALWLNKNFETFLGNIDKLSNNCA